MGAIREIQRVKLFAGVITRHRDLLPDVVEALTGGYGPIDHESVEYPFDFTDYYAVSMGRGLVRKFYSFERLINPDGIAEVKRWTNQLEEAVSKSGKWESERPVNIDPGYLTEAKLILLTTKDYSHRIYLDGGISAEITLTYRNGGYHPFEWTFPDYRSGTYNDYFTKVRETFRRQIAPASH